MYRQRELARGRLGLEHHVASMPGEHAAVVERDLALVAALEGTKLVLDPAGQDAVALRVRPRDRPAARRRSSDDHCLRHTRGDRPSGKQAVKIGVGQLGGQFMSPTTGPGVRRR